MSSLSLSLSLSHSLCPLSFSIYPSLSLRFRHTHTVSLSSKLLYHCSRNEIRSGTAVTYNDRQEILCQFCTNATLRDQASDDGRNSDQSTPTNELPDRPSVDAAQLSSSSSSQLERENGEHVDTLLDYSKISDVSPSVRARLGSTYCITCSI